MNATAKTLSLWSLYAAVLVMAAYGVHHLRGAAPIPAPRAATGIPPRPRAPAVPTTVAGKPVDGTPTPRVPTPTPPAAPAPTVLRVVSEGDLDRDGAVSFRVVAERPVDRRIIIRPHVSADRAASAHLETSPDEQGALVIEAGQRPSTPLLLKKRAVPDNAGGPSSRALRVANVRITWDPPAGARFASDGENVRVCNLTVTRFGPPYRVTLSGPQAFRETDARKGEVVPIEFRLDRPAEDHEVLLGFGLGGTALPEDYEVVDRPHGDVLSVEPGGSVAKLRLKRLPGPRGLGPRAVHVSCVTSSPSDVASAPGGEVVSADEGVDVAIPDQVPALSWTAAPPDAAARDPRLESSARLTLVARPPSSKPMQVRYRTISAVRDDVPSAERTLVIPPPADVWAQDESVAVHVLRFPPDDRVLPPDDPPGKVDALADRVRIEPVGGAPGLKPLEVLAHDPDRRPLNGRLLVVLALTQGARPGGPVIRDLSAALNDAAKQGLSGRLVDATVFLLDARQRLYRFLPGTLDDRKAFPPGTPLSAMLGKESRRSLRELIGRVDEKDQGALKKVLLICDSPVEPAERVADAIGEGLLGDNWSVYVTGPERADAGHDVDFDEISRTTGHKFARLRDPFSRLLIERLGQTAR